MMETVHSRTVKFTKIADDTVEIRYFDNREVNLKDAIADYNLFDRFTAQQGLKQLIIFGHFSFITIRAGNFIMSETKKRRKKIIAEAIVVETFRQLLGALIYKFRFWKAIPIRIFYDVAEAKKWLDAIPATAIRKENSNQH